MASYERKMPRAELKAQAKKIMASNRGMMTLLSLIYLVCLGIQGFTYELHQMNVENVTETIQAQGPGAIYMATQHLSSATSTQMALFSILGMICGILVNGVVAYAYQAWCLKQTQYKGKKLNFADFIDGFGEALKAILAYIWQNIWIFIWSLTIIPGIIIAVVGAAVLIAGTDGTVGLVMTIGGALLIVASFVVIYIASLRYTFMYQVMADGRGRVGVRQAMRYSITICKHHLDEVFVLFLSFIPWVVLSFVTFGLGFLYVLPYIYITLSLAYAWLRDEAFREGRLHPSKLGYTSRQPKQEDAAEEAAVPAPQAKDTAMDEKAIDEVKAETAFDEANDADAQEKNNEEIMDDFDDTRLNDKPSY